MMMRERHFNPTRVTVIIFLVLMFIGLFSKDEAMEITTLPALGDCHLYGKEVNRRK